MRWIFRYTDDAAKQMAKILKKKMPKPEPWMHIAIKTKSERNPWCGAVIYIWDTRQVLWEYRSEKVDLDRNQFMKERGWTRALDNRQPLVGGRKDINEYFEFGAKYDASHGTAFDGKERVEGGNVYSRKAKIATESH